MKIFILSALFLLNIITPVYGQADTSSAAKLIHNQSPEKPKEDSLLKYGFTMLGGLGKGGNNLVDGFAAGINIRAHYRFHTLAVYTSLVNRLEYHGAESSSSTLRSVNRGFIYGVGVYKKNVSASIGAGLSYSLVDMSTGGGAYYKEYHYRNYGACIGGQFSVHGKYVGFGIQAYYNLASAVSNYTLLAGIEVGLH